MVKFITRAQVGFRRNWFLLLSGVLIAISVQFFYASFFWSYVIDDAYITFTYSKNFSDLNGFVFRIGNDVAATSSVLWALLLGVLSKIVFDPVSWSKIAGAVLGTITVLMILVIFAEKEKSAFSRVIIVIGASLPFSFGLWANYGMENPALAILCLFLAYLAPRTIGHGFILLTSVVAIGVLCVRPEGFGYVAVVYGLEFFRRYICREKLNPLFGVAILVLILYSIVIICYYLNFGVFFPDSASAKLTNGLMERVSGGFDYVFNRGNFSTIWFVMVFLVFIGYDLFFKKLLMSDAGSATIFHCAGLTVATLFFSVLSGGDWMPGLRFLSVITPFCAGYVAWFISRNSISVFSRGAAMIYIMLLAFSQMNATNKWMPLIRDLHKGETEAVIQMTIDLNSIATKSNTLALSDIGYASYQFVGDVFDWWGLASREVTKRGQSLGRIEGATIREKNPEFLVVYSNTSDGPHSSVEWTGSESMSRGIVSDENLMRNYCVLKHYKFWEGRYHVLFSRKDIFYSLIEKDNFPKKFSVKECINPLIDKFRSA